MTKEIKLTRGKAALVDDEDYEWLMKWKWHAHEGRKTWYAARMVSTPKRAIVRMHREISGVGNNPEMKVDHCNENGLDNRKENLRVCSNKQNMCNRGKQNNNTTGYKGVSRSGKKFIAYIKVNQKTRYLGTYSSVEEAAKAYDKGAIRYFGEFAGLNFARNNE